MADRRVTPAGPDKLQAWMRGIDEQLAMLKRRKVQGDLTFQSAAIGAATVGTATIDDLTIGNSLRLPGNRVLPSPLSDILDIQTGFANTGAGIAALTTSFQDLPGTSRTFVPNGTSSIIHVTAMFDFNGATTGWTQMFGCMNINGVDNGIVAIKQDQGTANNRSTVTLTHAFAVPTTGLTIGMRARKTGAGGTASVPATISIWTWVYIDQN